MKIAISAALLAAYFVHVHAAPVISSSELIEARQKSPQNLFPKFVWSRQGTANPEKREKAKVDELPVFGLGIGCVVCWDARKGVEKRDEAKVEEIPLFVSNGDGGWVGIERRGEADATLQPLWGPLGHDGWGDIPGSKREEAKAEQIPVFTAEGDGGWELGHYPRDETSAALAKPLWGPLGHDGWGDIPGSRREEAKVEEIPLWIGPEEWHKRAVAP